MNKIIWIINEYAGSPYHGMEFRHYYLGRKFVEHGYKVFVITASYSHLFQTPPYITRPFEMEDIDGVRYIWVKVPPYKSSHDKKRILKWFVFTCKVTFSLPVGVLDKPNVIIVSPMAPFPVIAAYKWKKKFDAKMIYEIKDIWPLSVVELGGYSFKNPLIALMHKIEIWGYKKSNKVVSTLPRAFDYLKEFIDKDKYGYIPNGVYIHVYDKIENIPENIMEFYRQNEFIVGYAGTLGLSNALEFFLESAKLLLDKKIKFVIIGDGSEKNRLLHEYGGLRNVEFLSPVDKRQILKVIKMFDVAYIGWRKRKIYNYGISANKIFDYMLAGVPILHSFSGKGDIVKMANAGITVEAENPKAIAEGILKLYNMSPEERKRLGENGRRYVLEHHTYEKLAEKYISLFRQLWANK